MIGTRTGHHGRLSAEEIGARKRIHLHVLDTSNHHFDVRQHRLGHAGEELLHRAGDAVCAQPTKRVRNKEKQGLLLLFVETRRVKR